MYITEIRTYGGNVCTNFCGLNELEDSVDYKSFTIVSIDSLFLYEIKYCLQVYLGNFDHKIVNK